MSTWLDTLDAGKLDTWLTMLRERPAVFARVTPYAGGDERFTVWLALVDRRVQRAVGVGLFDLADWNMRDSYESGESPRDAALEALRNDDTYAALVEEAGL